MAVSRKLVRMIATLILAAAAATATAKSGPCDGVKNPPLCRELLDVYDRDQMAHAKSTKPKQAEKIEASDLARVQAIINSFGWPGKSLVGEKASAVAWTVIQHADLATQKLWLDTMTKAVEAKELSPALLARTIDLIAVREGRPQTYGTQPNAPIDDEEHVDDRRAKVGLPPLRPAA